MAKTRTLEERRDELDRRIRAREVKAKILDLLHVARLNVRGGDYTAAAIQAGMVVDELAKVNAGVGV